MDTCRLFVDFNCQDFTIVSLGLQNTMFPGAPWTEQLYTVENLIWFKNNQATQLLESAEEPTCL